MPLQALGVIDEAQSYSRVCVRKDDDWVILEDLTIEAAGMIAVDQSLVIFCDKEAPVTVRSYQNILEPSNMTVKELAPLPSDK